MNEPRDEIDSWLDREVDLLPPPPGTFTAIRARARRRKRNQALLTAAAAVVVVAGAVTGPTVLRSALTSGPAKPAASGQHRTISQSPSSSPARTSRPSPRTSSASTGPRSTLVNSTTSPPSRFRPTSITFVASGSGTLLGAAIGQAGPPCAGGTICTSMASTHDYGATWYGFSAPSAPSAAKPGGVSQVRFITPEVGWAFGPGLYATADSGAKWMQQQVPGGGRVLDLEGADGYALALVGSCTGTGSNYAASCTSFSLYSYQAAVPGRGWRQVSLPVKLTAGGQPTAARLVVAGATGFVLAPDGKVLQGRLDGRSWKVRATAPCTPGAPLADGAPAGALLASGANGTTAYLFVYCAGSTRGLGAVSALVGAGSRWVGFGTVQLRGGQPTSLAGAQDVTVLATTGGIFYAGQAGHWQAATVALPPGGFSYIGMTNSAQGVAIPAEARLGEVFTTSDGGRTWQADHID